jgi:hypothetical protein
MYALEALPRVFQITLNDSARCGTSYVHISGRAESRHSSYKLTRF